MSYFVLGSSLNYRDYLQAKSFVRDITLGSAAIVSEIDRSSREVIGSVQDFAERGADLQEAITEGVEQICSNLGDIRGGIAELNATFHWGFASLASEVGRVNDSLQELLHLARNPAQTWAYNQFEIARDAFRKRLYPEALEALARAIEGQGSSPGYRLDHRFHFIRGLIFLGDVSNSTDLIDLEKAREAFEAAARYAAADFPDDAARSYLFAGWAAYCGDHARDALELTKKCLEIGPQQNSEALFQLAKVAAHLGMTREALASLRKACDIDVNFATKAASDGDFRAHPEALAAFLRSLLEQKRTRAETAIRKAREGLREGGTEVGQAFLAGIEAEMEIPTALAERGTILSYEESIRETKQIVRRLWGVIGSERQAKAARERRGNEVLRQERIPAATLSQRPPPRAAGRGCLGGFAALLGVLSATIVLWLAGH